MSFPVQQGLFKYDVIDHYAVLGVPLGADSRQIRQRYLKIAYILHPDTFRGKTEREKNRANKILSKLVNPAYEQLSKDRSRNEYSLVLAQMGHNLAKELSSITLATDEAQKLMQTSHNAELTYHKLLLPIIASQYNDLEQVFNKIAQISELNLIYLMIKQGEQIKAKARPKPPSQTPPSAKSKTEKKEQVSAIATSLKRAQDYIKRNNTSQAVIELREILKKEPNNSSCHGLLGLAYIKENQLTMAKVHINKARKVNPQDPIVIEAKEALDKVSPEENKAKSADKPQKTGLFGSLFGKNR
ncbi:J domain-containing protein [Crocosphaera sp. UHCC 0190]|uniref:J domain-containing protein n=1 Tax=Crocosphaera sp. UHCC 0190 TaxID=3110246 RepID=UPI002B1F3307|nr:J domain-containing protein [Crocosphaera sp. UHCC 0190]MEA5511530.1 J domain-containing protein [Crocosphaera sp. UHCC 0190]